jgi:hypothetical protein
MVVTAGRAVTVAGEGRAWSVEVAASNERVQGVLWAAKTQAERVGSDEQKSHAESCNAAHVHSTGLRGSDRRHSTSLLELRQRSKLRMSHPSPAMRPGGGKGRTVSTHVNRLCGLL